MRGRFTLILVIFGVMITSGMAQDDKKLAISEDDRANIQTLKVQQQQSVIQAQQLQIQFNNQITQLQKQIGDMQTQIEAATTAAIKKAGADPDKYELDMQTSKLKLKDKPKDAATDKK